MAGHYGFFKKKGGAIVKAPLVKWAGYRREGYEFATEEEYNKQRAEEGAKAAEANKKKVSKKKASA